MQVRRDIYRSNTLSRRKKDEREEACEMLDMPVSNPIDLPHEMVEGVERLSFMPTTDPTTSNNLNLALVDKNTRFVKSIPTMVMPSVLAQSYSCWTRRDQR